MIVKELIEELSKYPEDTLVMVDGYEGGIQSPGSIELVKARKIRNASRWEGNYEYCRDWSREKMTYTIDVVLIPR